MPVLHLETRIGAPRSRCFDLARHIDFHQDVGQATGQRAIGGVTQGLMALGDTVTWRARHFGVWQTLTSRITLLDRPRHFRDTMERGIFHHIQHDHRFEEDGDGCVMLDEFDFASPLGPLGRAADRLLLAGYMRRFIAARNTALRALAQGEGWRRYLTE